jgi:hypothetical protein
MPSAEDAEYGRQALEYLSSQYVDIPTNARTFESLLADEPTEDAQFKLLKLLRGMSTIAAYALALRAMDTDTSPESSLAEIGRILQQPM